MSGLHLLISDSNGVYIPQIFATRFENWGVKPLDAALLAGGPQTEFYWDAWQDILDAASYTDENGNEWRLWQDGDLWAWCEELMSDEELLNFFGEV